MAVTDLGAQVKEWALDEVRKQAFTEDYGVDVSWVPQPVQAGGGVQMVPGWLLLITARNPLLGQGPLFHLAPVGAPAVLEENVRAEVTKGVRALRDLAASKLAGLNGKAPKVPLSPGSR